MNWNLVSKDKNGEIQVSFFWISVLIVFIGFIFGIGFNLAGFIINLVSDYFYNETTNVFKMLFPMVQFILLLLVVVMISQVILKMNKENKK